MDATSDSQPTPTKNRTTAERKSDREMVITRTINGPVRIVYEAWTKPEIFQRWWVPKSAPISLRSCEQDVRVGGRYRLVFDVAGREPMAFFGTYLEVSPRSRLVWTNEEAGDAGAVTTVTFEDRGDKTVVVMSELYPSKEALDEAITCGSQDGSQETFEQLEELVGTLLAGVS